MNHRMERGSVASRLCRRFWLCALLFSIVVSAEARAGVIDTPGENLEASLITYGPGSSSWERFGHDAIRLHDRVSGESADFNFGVFDFEDSAFLWKFARGQMQYLIDVEPSAYAQQRYIDAGRSVLEQHLALSPAQAVSLRSSLLWNLRPENTSYNYDYLTNNCATRVRDTLSSAVGGALQSAFVARPAQMTYRQQIDRLMSANVLMMLAMDFGLGPAADRPLNEWQESFLPMILARELRSVRIPDGLGGVRPLVQSERQIAPNRLVPPRAVPPDLGTPLGIAGLALAAVMLISRARRPALHNSLVATYLVFAGLAGTVLLALWTLTAHHAAWENANLLVFNPLAFVILAAAWQTRYKGHPSRLVRTLIAFQLGAALLSVLLHLRPGGTAQQNLPWLLWGIPPWLAIAFDLWPEPKRSSAETISPPAA